MEPSEYICFPITHSEFTYSYTGVIFRDGRGVVYEGSDEFESVDELFAGNECEFEHERSDFEALGALAKEDRDNLLLEWFIDEINPTLDDQFVFNLQFQDEDLTFENGSAEALERLVGLIVLTEPGIDPDSADYIEIESGDTCGNGNQLSESSYHSERIAQLVEYASEENSFSGRTGAEYNDGPHDRDSGYSSGDLSVSYQICDFFKNASARERMKAPAELRAWLVSKGYDADLFLEDLEKIA